ncbi:MAG: (Fe-S)-binding protein [Candidatus Wallbacteria bacterium]|nr:(Fe-S)-binding protein [Candidatus Wallbacteria bacterium]
MKINPSNCLKCNLCAENCPVYKLFPIERHSPRGMLKLIENGFNPQLCTLCGKCEKTCPPGIQIRKKLLEKLPVFSKKSRFFSSALSKPFDPHECGSETLLFLGCRISDLPEKRKKKLFNALADLHYQIDELNCCGWPHFLTGQDPVEKIEELRNYFSAFKMIVFACPHCYGFWKMLRHELDFEVRYYLEVMNFQTKENVFFSCLAQGLGFSNKFTGAAGVQCCGSGGGILELSSSSELKSIRKSFRRAIGSTRERYFDCGYCLEAAGSGKFIWE